MDSKLIYLPLAVLAVFISFIAVSRIPRNAPSDIYSPWYGTKELLLYGRNPYGPEVSRKIQVGFYGHVLSAAEHRDEQRFAYPIPVVIVLWPLAFLSFHTANVIGYFVLMGACVGIVVASMQFIGWPATSTDRALVLLMGLTTGPVLRDLEFEQLTALVALFLICAFLTLRKGNLLGAGVLLALSTIKPQLALVPVLWLLMWTLSNWKERARVMYGFAAALTALLVIAEILLPGWMLDFLKQAHAYRQYAGDGSFLTMLAGKWIGLVASLILTAVIGWYAVSRRMAGPRTAEFELATAVVLALPPFIMPTMAPQHNQVMLFPLALIVLRELKRFSRPIQLSVIALLVLPPILRAASIGGIGAVKPGLLAVGVLFPLVLAFMMVVIVKDKAKEREAL